MYNDAYFGRSSDELAADLFIHIHDVGIMELNIEREITMKFEKMLIAAFISIILGLIMDTYVFAAEIPVLAPVVGLTQEREGNPSLATILTSDGNTYVVENPWEDTFPGDIWLISRNTKGNQDPTDDEMKVVKSVGYEKESGIPGVYEWYIWDRSKGEYMVTHSTY